MAFINMHLVIRNLWLQLSSNAKYFLNYFGNCLSINNTYKKHLEMKTLSKLGMMVALGSALFLSSCAGEYYVSDQPADVVYEPGAPPYAGAVWIGDDWVWSGGRYVHQRG